MTFLRKISLAFSAGSLGALANSIAAWLFGLLGITAAFGVHIAPALSKSWLYPRIVWGGIWGLVLLVPLIRKSSALNGAVLSIAPTLVTLLVVFTLKGKGMMGMELGTLTPMFPLIFNAIWGAVAGAWYGLVNEDR